MEATPVFRAQDGRVDRAVHQDLVLGETAGMTLRAGEYGVPFLLRLQSPPCSRIGAFTVRGNDHFRLIYRTQWALYAGLRGASWLFFLCTTIHTAPA